MTETKDPMLPEIFTHKCQKHKCPSLKEKRQSGSFLAPLTVPVILLFHNSNYIITLSNFPCISPFVFRDVINLVLLDYGVNKGFFLQNHDNRNRGENTVGPSSGPELES